MNCTYTGTMIDEHRLSKAHLELVDATTMKYRFPRSRIVRALRAGPTCMGFGVLHLGIVAARRQ